MMHESLPQQTFFLRSRSYLTGGLSARLEEKYRQCLNLHQGRNSRALRHGSSPTLSSSVRSELKNPATTRVAMRSLLDSNTGGRVFGTITLRYAACILTKHISALTSSSLVRWRFRTCTSLNARWEFLSGFMPVIIARRPRSQRSQNQSSSPQRWAPVAIPIAQASLALQATNLNDFREPRQSLALF